MPYIAFAGHRRVAWGDLPGVARALRHLLDDGETRPLAVFDASSSAPVDLDLRGSADEAARRAEQWLAGREAAAEKTGPGRPRLGVVAREVTLLPRHWDWLGAQPGGASVTLRKLVEAARKSGQGDESVRRRQDAAYRFLHALAGDLPGFEEAVRALYAWDLPRLRDLTAHWPPDLRAQLDELMKGE